MTSEQHWEQLPDLMLRRDLQYHGPCSIPGLEDPIFPGSVPRYPVPDTMQARTRMGHLQPSQPSPGPAPGAEPHTSALALQLPRDLIQIHLDLDKGTQRRDVHKGCINNRGRRQLDRRTGTEAEHPSRHLRSWDLCSHNSPKHPPHSPLPPLHINDLISPTCRTPKRRRTALHYPLPLALRSPDPENFPKRRRSGRSGSTGLFCPK